MKSLHFRGRLLLRLGLWAGHLRGQKNKKGCTVFLIQRFLFSKQFKVDTRMKNNIRAVRPDYLLSGVQILSGWMGGASVPLGSVNSSTFLSAPAIETMPHTCAANGTGGGEGFPGT